jgi:hypothetical protein
MDSLNKKLFQEVRETTLPLIANFLNAKTLTEIEASENSAKYIAIDFYQSQAIKTFPYYKPISKIVTSASLRK